MTSGEITRPSVARHWSLFLFVLISIAMKYFLFIIHKISPGVRPTDVYTGKVGWGKRECSIIVNDWLSFFIILMVLRRIIYVIIFWHENKLTVTKQYTYTAMAWRRIYNIITMFVCKIFFLPPDKKKKEP